MTEFGATRTEFGAIITIHEYIYNNSNHNSCGIIVALFSVLKMTDFGAAYNMNIIHICL
jgi:hypothetical protein